jgi:hypothetical protein
VSRPYGKWAKYSLEDGTKNIYQEGLYLGDKKSWNRLVTEKKLEKDFREN